MKQNKKNDMVSVILMITAVSLMITLELLVMKDDYFLKQFDDNILTLAITLVAMTVSVYSMLILKRKNPKVFIYLSYAEKDKQVVKKINTLLDDNINKLSKYRFEILSLDSVSYGDDIVEATDQFLRKADRILIVFSSAYMESKWCMEELTEIIMMNKHFIPIFLEENLDFSKMPEDISKIKGLSLFECTSQEDFDKNILLLAKDLIKHRKN